MLLFDQFSRLDVIERTCGAKQSLEQQRVGIFKSCVLSIHVSGSNPSNRNFVKSSIRTAVCYCCDINGFLVLMSSNEVDFMKGLFRVII